MGLTFRPRLTLTSRRASRLASFAASLGVGCFLKKFMFRSSEMFQYVDLK